MIKNICNNISLNKNLLMLVTVGIYILALFSVLSGSQVFISILLTFIFARVLFKDYFKPKYILVWALIFYFGMFNISSRIKDTDDLLNCAPVNSTIYGKIISIPQKVGQDKMRFFFDVKKIEYDGLSYEFNNEKAIITLNTDEKLQIYAPYRIEGRLSIPFKAGNPSQFDYGNYLRNHNAYAVFYGKEFTKIEGNISGKERFLQWINNYREKILLIHAKNLDSPNLEILGGIVFGDDAVSPPENIKQSFINSGLLHILAASGMNVAFIFTFFFYFLSLMKVNYKVNISVCIIMVILYSLMTGLGPSVIRAAFMLVFVLIGKLIDRDAHSISLLAFVAFLMLIYNPFFINDVGFQLSFIVTFGLLLMTPYIVKSKKRIVNWLLGSIFVPIIAQLWVIPIQIFYFKNISLYSVFANIMSVPILSVISFCGFLSSLIAGITPEIICKIFDFLLNPLITILVNISDFWGSLPNSAIRTTHPTIIQILIYYGILLNFTGFLAKELREKYFKPFCISFMALILLLLLTLIPIKNNNLEITAFDVGNADSFFIKTPTNEYIMIDTAKNGYNGGKSQAEIVIIKYLLDRGIKVIDSLILTHFDNDHCGGAVDIMKSIKVKNLYVNSLEHDSIAAREIYKIAKEKNVKVVLAENNQVIWNKSGLEIKNFVSNNTIENDDNEASIISLLKYGKFSMLFMGDAGINTFMELKNNFPQQITVLKVGHHGALGSINKSMVNYLNPKYSLISVGENKFGHPSIYTLDVLKDTNILRTDIYNSIKFLVNENKLKIFSYDIKRRRYKECKNL